MEEMLYKPGKLALAFDDVLLVPAASKVLPKDVSLKTRLTKKISLNIPLLSAAMDTVTEENTAIAIARHGGIGIIHKNISAEEQAEKVGKVKRAEFFIIPKPYTIKPTDNLAAVQRIRAEHGFSSFPVTENGKLVGILTARDMLFETNAEKSVSEMMTKDVVTVSGKVNMEKAKEMLHQHRIEKLPIVDERGNLTGLISIGDIRRREEFPNSVKDSKGRLMVGAAVGPKDDRRLEQLIEAELDVAVVDTSHGHSQSVLDAVKRYKKEFGIEIIAGNIATAKAAEDLIAAGADAVKVGLGPGAICTTRVISGVGVPQFTAILECSAAAEKSGIPVIADGGIRYSGDITKALAAGASSIMIGSLFAGCEETPGRIVYMQNRKFKQYRGMGSLGAMQKGGKDRYFQAEVEEKSKLVPEGIEGVVPYKGGLAEVVYQLLGGLRSGMGLVGAQDIDSLRKKTKWIRVTASGQKESHPHNVTVTEEAPNYPRL